jgi:hypothetical protein
MKQKTQVILGVSILAFGALYAGPAEARPALSQCSIAGVISAGGMLEGDTFTSGSSSATGNWNALFGEAAGLVTCDAWNFQADIARYGHSAWANGKNNLSPEGHFGGDIFWRDPNSGDFGIQASYVNQVSVFNAIDGNFDIVRGGIFGNYYLNDKISLGGDAHLFTTTHNNFHPLITGGKGYNGFELSANAKYYVTPDLKLSAIGDFMQSQFVSSSAGPNMKVGGAALTLQADYQFTDFGLTGFIGGRLAHRVLWSTTSSSENLDDRQVFVGLTLPLGANPGSLVQHDRTGTVNNTSTFLEKLPSVFDDPIIAIIQSF